MGKAQGDEGNRARKERMRHCLVPLVESAGALCVFLVSKSGLPMASCGDTTFADEGDLASLVAGAFAATRELAELLGEDEFSIMLGQGDNRHVHLSLVSRDAMLVVIFERSDRVGLVRFYAKSVQKRLQSLLPGAKEKTERAEKDFEAYKTSLIDKLFRDTP